MNEAGRKSGSIKIKRKAQEGKETAKELSDFQGKSIINGSFFAASSEGSVSEEGSKEKTRTSPRGQCGRRITADASGATNPFSRFYVFSSFNPSPGGRERS